MAYFLQFIFPLCSDTSFAPALRDTERLAWFFPVPPIQGYEKAPSRRFPDPADSLPDSASRDNFRHTIYISAVR
jgi:hypothetical protein